MTMEITAGLVAVLICIVNVASLGLAWQRLGRTRPPAREPATPPISVIRPLCGLERFSEETLRSSFELSYPTYELIFCIARGADPIIAVVHRLAAAYPGVTVQILIGDVQISANPKLNNCVRGWHAAKHDWIVMADSNVLMPRDYLQQMLAVWKPNTGLVCSTPIGHRPHNFWAEVECAFLNTLQARWQYAGEALGLGFAQGKSMLWHRDFLESAGGITALAAEIAEDAAATKLVRKAGFKVHLVNRPFQQPLGRRKAHEIWSRQLRWARLRRVTFPTFFAPEIASGAVLPLGMLGYALGAHAEWLAPAVGALLLTWYGFEMALARAAGWHLSWRSPFAYLVRDVMIVPIWLYAWVAKEIVWHGNRMRIVVGAKQIGDPASAA